MANKLVAKNLVANGIDGVFKKVLSLGALATLAVAVVGSVAGYLVAKEVGVISALFGALICFAFTALTAVSVWFGSRLSFGGFFGLVLGGWVLKLIVFIAIVANLRGAEFIDGKVFFFTLVAAVLAGLAIDSIVFLKARIPIEPKG